MLQLKCDMSFYFYCCTSSSKIMSSQSEKHILNIVFNWIQTALKHINYVNYNLQFISDVELHNHSELILMMQSLLLHF
jgi:hypothetical protein